MKARLLLCATGIITLAACGANNGNGDNSPTNAITPNPAASVVCTSAPNPQICGPTPSPSSTPSTG